MPNYKRIIPRTPTVTSGGIVRLYVNANGDLVAQYASGNIQVLDIAGGTPPGPLILDGNFAPNTQTIVRNGGNAGTVGSNDINAGGSLLSL